jgi:cell division protein FtsB
MSHNYVKNTQSFKKFLPPLGRGVTMQAMPRLTLPTLMIFLLLFSFLLVQSYLNVRKKAQRLELLQEETASLAGRKEDLEEELSYRQSPLYVEGEARDRLGYAKKGEVVVVIADSKEEGKRKEKAEEAPSLEELAFSQEETPVWKRWGCLWFPKSWTCPVVEF